jgi:putative ABC transport system permease protein
MNTLFRSSFRYFLKHPWQLALSIIGVALGVAIVVAIDLANSSARAAFERSSESVSGAATHHIVGNANGFNDSIYAALRVSSLREPIAPIVEGNVILAEDVSKNNPQTSERKQLSTSQRTVFRVFGVDVFAEKPFRPYLQNAQDARSFDLAPFFITKNAIVLSTETASNLKKAIGDTIMLERGGKNFSAILVGTVQPSDEASARALSDIIICDISTAQELLEMQGKLSRIDLKIPLEQEEQYLTNVTRRLPEGLEIMRSLARPKRIQDMARAFDLNLTALSLLALMVGVFIIYNTMTFSVVQRRPYLGILRVLGMTGREAFMLVLAESLVIGFIGTCVGLALGIVLGNGLVRLVSQTINDLYFTVTVNSLDIAPLSLLKGALLGICGVVAATILPAREATRTQPRMVLNRSEAEQRIQSRVWLYSILGVVSIALGIAILYLPSTSIYAGYAGLVPVILGFAFLVPLTTKCVIWCIRPILQKTSGVVGNMAARGVTATLSRTGIAIAALMVAVSATIGVGIMVSSFRQTVVEWLTYTLTADIYISPPNLVARRGDAVVDSIAEQRIITHPAVREHTSFRTILTEGEFLTNSPQGKEQRLVQILTTVLKRTTKQRFHFKDADTMTVWRDFAQGSTIVSETFAFKNDIQCGDTIKLATDVGLKRFPVCGIYYDYASDVGTVVIERETFQKYWADSRSSGISVFVKSGIPLDSVIHDLRALTNDRQELLIRSNKALLATSLEIFDRTFAITDVLRLLTIMVSFVGVLSALMALQFEKAREIGILRANGLTPRQVWFLTTLQTAIIGIIAGILALPIGIILALALIFVINQRSFGWTLQLYLSPEILLQALILAVLAATLAGLYPAWKTSRTSPALALREE